MKTFLPVCLMVALVFAAPSGAFAKKKKGGPPHAVPTEPNPANPTEALAPFINSIDNLLALNRTVTKANAAFLTQSSGRIITLRQGFIGQLESAADDQKGKYKAA